MMSCVSFYFHKSFYSFYDFQTYIQSKPDLYGPFWVCVTLIITIAISGNIANYLQAAATHKYHWKYDFHAISTSATAIFSYAWLLPVLVWGYLKYQNDSEVGIHYSSMQVIVQPPPQKSEKNG